MMAIASAVTWLAIIGGIFLGFTFLQNEGGYRVHPFEQWTLLALWLAVPIAWWAAL